VFPLTSLFEAPQETTALEIITMFANAGTFLVVAIVAGGLAERFRSRAARCVTCAPSRISCSSRWVRDWIALDRSQHDHHVQPRGDDDYRRSGGGGDGPAVARAVR